MPMMPSFCSRGVRVATGVLTLVALASPVRVASAQRLAAETLLDVEGWKTDDGSRLLARNGGKPSYSVRGFGFLVYEATRGVTLRAIGYVDQTDSDEFEKGIDLLSLRIARSRAFTVEAGKILMPLSAFGPRRFSVANPLIGGPDMYPTQYPLGAVATGARGHLDYKAGVVSLPPVNVKYTTAPRDRARPVVGLGWSTGPTFRVGASYTQGSYLGAATDAAIPVGAVWSQFQQRLALVDAHWSRGFLDARAELARASYEVPTIAKPVVGTGWYGELRYTIAPRWFVATRYEDYAYPFVKGSSRVNWTGTVVTQRNGEIGIGYRATSDLLLKTSLRRDHWPVHVSASGRTFPDGYALAFQMSWHASLTDLVSRP